MLGQIDAIRAEVFGQSSALAQIAVILFVVSIILLLLSLVSFQLSRIRQREEDRRYRNQRNVPVDTAPRTQPVVSVSWGQFEEDKDQEASGITASQAEVKPEILPEELHEDTVADLPQQEEVVSDKVIGEMPVNVTYLNRSSANNSGSVQARRGADLSGQRIGPLVFHSSKPDTLPETPSEKDAGLTDENLDGFIFNQRRRAEPAKSPRPVMYDHPETDAPAATTNSLSSTAPPPDTSDDQAFAELGKIEDLMKELKKTYQAGQISSDVYAAESRKLYDEAQQLMAKL